MANTAQYLGSGTVALGSSLSHTLDIPTDDAVNAPRPGDIVWLQFVFRNGTNTTISSIESGWTLAGRADDSTTLSVAVYYRIWTTADSTTNLATLKSVTLTGTVSNGYHSRVFVWRRSTRGTPVDTTAVTSTSAAALTWTPTGITTASADETIVSFVGTSDDNTLILNTANGFTLPTDGTYRTTSGSDHAGGMSYKVVTTATAYTCPTWEQSSVGPDTWAGVTVAFRDDATDVAAVLLGEITEVAVNDTSSTSYVRVAGEIAEVAVANTSPVAYARLAGMIVEVAVVSTVADIVATGHGSLTFTAQAPTVTTGATSVTTGSAAVTLSAQPPTVTTGATTLVTDSADLTLTAQPVTGFGSAVSFTTGSGQITLSAQAPTVATGTAFQTGTASLTFAAQAPTVTVGASSFTTGAAAVTLSAQPPTVVAGAVTVGADSADLLLTGQPPTITANVAFDTGSASLVFAGQAATVTYTEPAVLTGSAVLWLQATAVEPVVFEPWVLTGSAVLTVSAGPSQTLVQLTDTVDVEVPVVDTTQGDIGDRTVKRRSFSA